MKDKEGLVFHHGDDYDVWKKKVLGILIDKLEVFGLELEPTDWKKVNKVVKEEKEGEAYDTAQRKGLAIMWRYLDGGIIKKVGEVQTVCGLFKKLDGIYQRKGGVELVVLMHRLVNLRMGKELEKYVEEFEGIVGEMEKRGHKVVE